MWFRIFAAKPAPIPEQRRQEIVLPKGWDAKRGGYYPTEEELAEEEAIRQEYARTGFKDEPWKMALLKPRWSTDEDPPVNPFAVIQWDKHNAEFDEPVELPYVEPGPPKPHFKRYIALALFLFYLSSLINAYLVRRKKAQEHFFKLRRRQGIPDDDFRPWQIAQADVILRRHDRENLWRMENGLAPLWDNEDGVTIVLKEWDERGRPLPPKPTLEQVAQEKWEQKFKEERRRVLKDKRERGMAFEHPGAFKLLDDDLFDDEIYVAPEVVPVPESRRTPEPLVEQAVVRSKVVPVTPGERTRHRLPDPPAKVSPPQRPLHPAHTTRKDSVDAGPHNMMPLELAAFRRRERWAWHLQAEEFERQQAVTYGHYIERPSNPGSSDRPMSSTLPKRIDKSLVVIPDFRSMYGPQKDQSEKKVEKEKEREKEREQEALAQRATKKVKREAAGEKTDVPKDKGKGKAKDVQQRRDKLATDDAMDIDPKESKRGVKRAREELISDTGASEKEHARKRTKGPKGERVAQRANADATQPESKKSPETATTQLDSKKSPLTGKTTPPTIEDIATSPGASTVEPLDLDNMDGVRVDANGRPMRGDPCKGRKEGEEWTGRKWRMRLHNNERERLCAVICQEKMRGFGLPADEFTVHLWLDDEKFAQAVVNRRLDSANYEAVAVDPVNPHASKNSLLQKAGLNMLLGRKRSPTPPRLPAVKKARTPARSPPPIPLPPSESVEPVVEANPIVSPVEPTPTATEPRTRMSPGPLSPPMIEVIAPTPPQPSTPIASSDRIPSLQESPVPNSVVTPLGFTPVLSRDTQNASSTSVIAPSFAKPSTSPATVGNDFFARPPTNPQPLSAITQSFHNPFQQQAFRSAVTSSTPASNVPSLAQSVPVPVQQKPPASTFNISFGPSTSQQLNPLATPFTPPPSVPSAAPRNVRFDAPQLMQPMPAPAPVQPSNPANSNAFSFSFSLPSAPRLPTPATPQRPTRSSPLANEIIPEKPDVTVNQMVIDPASELGVRMSSMSQAEREEFMLVTFAGGVPPLSMFLKDGVPRFSTADAVKSTGPSFASLSPGPGFAPLIAAQQNPSTPTQAAPGPGPLTSGFSGSIQSNPPLSGSQGGFTAGAGIEGKGMWSGNSMFGKNAGNAAAHGLSISANQGAGNSRPSVTYGWTSNGRKFASNERILKKLSTNLDGAIFSNPASASVSPQVQMPNAQNTPNAQATPVNTAPVFTGFHHQLAPTGPTLIQQQPQANMDTNMG